MAAIGIVGLALSLPALVENCICYTKRLRKMIHTIKNAEVILESYWVEYTIYSNQMEASLDFVKNIAPHIPISLSESLRLALFRLTTASSVTIELTDRAFDDKGNLRKAWFTIYGKSDLEKSLHELNKCHDLFQRSLQFVVLFGGTYVESAGEKHIDQTPSLASVQNLKNAINDSLKDSSVGKLRMKEEDLPNGTMKVLHIRSKIRYLEPSDSDQQPILVEGHYDYTSQFDREVALGKYRSLARKLSGTSLEMGMLPCQGFIEGVDYCHLVFKTPHGMGKPYTLRQLLLSSSNEDTGPMHSLTHRVNLAATLATAVLYVHSAKLVHKNIRPENVLFFESLSDEPRSKYPYSLGTAVLMGFDLIRQETDRTFIGKKTHKGGDWKTNIYMHPQRQGKHPEVSYEMRHDIYSLGVVLLEIALWKSFLLEAVSDSGDISYNENPQVCQFHHSDTNCLKTPLEIQETLIETARNRIPRVLGEKYRDVVLLCLNALEGSFEGTEGLRDADGIIISLVFIQRVLDVLKGISL